MVQHSSPSKHGLPAGNPLASVLVVIAGIVAIATLIVLGFVAFLALGVVILVAATFVGIRSWWLARRMGVPLRGRARSSKQAPRDVIEGEYQVVDRDRDQP